MTPRRAQTSTVFIAPFLTLVTRAIKRQRAALVTPALALRGPPNAKITPRALDVRAKRSLGACRCSTTPRLFPNQGNGALSENTCRLALVPIRDPLGHR